MRRATAFGTARGTGARFVRRAGGKGTQLAAAMAGRGLLVLNEPVLARAQTLSRNVERLGVKNAVVLNEMPERLAAFFGEYFDKILVDAPCSGEGMFRKNPVEAIGEWSEENVQMCAARQRGILQSAAKMLRPGGRLVYSTCTFAEEEDEGAGKRLPAFAPRNAAFGKPKTVSPPRGGGGALCGAF